MPPKGPEGTPGESEKLVHPDQNTNLVQDLETMREQKRAEAAEAQRRKLERLEDVTDEHGAVDPNNRNIR